MQEMQEKKINTFDFYDKQQEKNRVLNEKSKAEKFVKFKKMAITSLAISLSIVVLTTASSFTYLSYQDNINKKIVAVETVIKQNPKENILNLIEREKVAVKKNFANNQLAINDYAKYKDLVDILKLGSSLGIKNANNAKLQKDSLQFLNADEKSINLVSDALTQTRDKKINILLKGEDIKKYNQWSESVNLNNFMYVGGLINLNKEINKELAYLEDATQDIIKTVNDKIKTKSYNLDAAQGVIAGKVASDVASEISGLKNIRKEIKGTESDSILTDKDVSEAEVAMADLQSAVTSKIKEDRTTVESMIAKAADTPISTATQTPTSTRQSSGGLTFLDYYLIHHWMSAGSTSSAYSSGYNNALASKSGIASSLDSSKPVNPYVATMSKNPANLYDFKNSDSYLNKSMDKSATSNFNANSLSKTGSLSSLDKVKGFNANKIDVGALRAKMEMAKSKSIQASNMRSAEVVKATQVKANSNVHTTSKSSVGFSSAGRSGGGGGHGGGGGGG